MLGDDVALGDEDDGGVHLEVEGNVEVLVRIPLLFVDVVGSNDLPVEDLVWLYEGISDEGFGAEPGEFGIGDEDAVVVGCGDGEGGVKSIDEVDVGAHVFEDDGLVALIADADGGEDEYLVEGAAGELDAVGIDGRSDGVDGMDPDVGDFACGDGRFVGDGVKDPDRHAQDDHGKGGGHEEVCAAGGEVFAVGAGVIGLKCVFF